MNASRDPDHRTPEPPASQEGDETEGLADFSLFEQEKQIMQRSEQMLEALDDVAEGVRMLAKAYSESYRVQRRMMRMSDRMQLDLQAANRQLREQATHLEQLNCALSDEVRERERLTAELERLALEDALTGLFSRRRVMDCVEGLAATVGERSRSLAVMMLDLDDFKALNDTHGHAAGDYALQSFADILREELGADQYAGRMGGEEFLVVAADLDLDEAMSLAERIRTSVEATIPRWKDQPLHLEVSIGLVVTTERWPDAGALVAAADDLLYRAKKEGRNRVEVQFHGEPA
ncbi:GGDEF domain-containing protein [Thioalkalivibrio thiocyanoxidans]|uniref:GGDEF domain-containing protein n=1 Tax=Thioalkalivibrio thiocyanoxidans TaxID=152475 RepID=UPI000367F259|nr:GGDEF domain-containing protein [Thioalkalivibrio thiocyanoxidans]